MSMSTNEFRPSKNVRDCLIFGFLLTLLYFLATWHLDIGLADEGYYWYGAQRILHGEVPILDFMSYDPGRYYIAAAAMAMVGSDGIWAARAAAFLVLGLLVSLGIYLALLSFHGKRIAQIYYSLIVALLLIVWTFPYFRTFDFLASALLIWAISIFFRQRTPRGWFLAGLILGVVAVLGRNHGVYGVFGHVVALVIIYLDRESAKPTSSSYFFWVAGVIAGYLPIILLTVFVDGFAQAFFESIKSIINSGTTNILLPVPWPWTVDFGKNGIIISAIYIAMGLFFIGLIAFSIAGLSYVVLARKFGLSLKSSEAGNSVFLASICLALPYAQYAFSRSDIVHLASSMLPMIFGMLSIPLAQKTKPRILMGLFLLGSGLFVMVDSQPALRYFFRPEQQEIYTIGSDKIQMSLTRATAIRNFDRLIEAEIARGGSFLALPNYPTLHAIHRSKMSVWEIYSLFHRTKSFEEKEIKRIEEAKPSLVILSNHALDKNEALRYSNTHPLIYQWLNTQYRKEYIGNDIEIYRNN